jgi:hypothetical protein
MGGRYSRTEEMRIQKQLKGRDHSRQERNWEINVNVNAKIKVKL